jgi:methylmalonyl-CoA mutase
MEAASWQAVAAVSGNTPAEINSRALHALQHGGESILFDCTGLSDGHIPYCLDGILPQYAALYMQGMDAYSIHRACTDWLNSKKISYHHLQGALLHDAADLLQMDERDWVNITHLFASELPNFNPFGADTAEWRGRGLSAPQEIALSCLCLYRQLSVRWSKAVSEKGDSAPTKAMKLPISLPISLSVGCTTEFFDELSRLRALRAIIYRVAHLFNHQNEPELQFRIEPQILVRIPAESLPVEDPHTNLLRLTTMGISAVLGGCTALSLPPFDHDNSQKGDFFADELSLQLQMILRHEAFPGLPMDAGAGSGCIEHISHSQGERAWTILGDLVALCTKEGQWNAAALYEVLNDWCTQGKEQLQRKRDRGLRIRVGVDRYRMDDLYVHKPAAT